MEGEVQRRFRTLRVGLFSGVDPSQLDNGGEKRPIHLALRDVGWVSFSDSNPPSRPSPFHPCIDNHPGTLLHTSAGNDGFLRLGLVYAHGETQIYTQS